ncbi:MAG: lysophospholipid acyltransferase family protein [Candidatus Aenigmatarchaeota archaeon]
MLYQFLKPITIAILKIFFGFQVKGKEVFPLNKPFILASNHLSNLDPVVLGAACPYRLYFLAKEELFENPLFALLIKTLGAIPLKRGGSNLKVMRLALNILKNKPLVIFPQGTRKEELDTFKAGVGFLYKKSKAPIIVAKIFNTDKVLPKNAKFIKKREKIRVIFDRLEGAFESDSYDLIALKVIDRIKKLNN